MSIQPNAKESRWLEAVVRHADDFGSVIPGYLFYEIHHVAGRTYIHNKVPIGHWFILPMPIELHSIRSNHPLNVTYYRKKFTEQYGSEREIFQDMVDKMRNHQYIDPLIFPDQIILDAIQDTRY